MTAAWQLVAASLPEGVAVPAARKLIYLRAWQCLQHGSWWQLVYLRAWQCLHRSS
jgi:hypothetical protein